ncbi:unnamed protein product [Prorocentrum cordatum]|uniref:Uncharacterized protein n=1 Tax=Prorocentrum cordatum TaxID=2364126 RepID=A0ABN9WYS8_9DINO|nr:unnamed protein product [Polarella glacialis]
MPRAFPMEAANLPACGMKSFGVSMGKEGHTNDVMVAAWDKAKTMPVLEVLAKPDVVGKVDKAGAAVVWDLPSKQWRYPARRPIKGFIDVIANCGDLSGVNWDVVKEAMAEGRYNALPPPLGISDAGQNEIPCVMSMHVSKSMPDDGYLVVKVFTFLGGGEPMAAILEKIVEGDPCVLDYRPDTFNTVRTMQVVLEAMGGLLFRYWGLPKPKAVADIDAGEVAEKKAALDRAWDFVQAEAPRGNFDGQRVLWLEHQYVDPDSPIYNMKREFVNSLMKCIADRDHFATKEDYYPLLKPDIRKEYQPMTNRILKTLMGNTLLTIGEAGFGKTPFMYICAMATARHNADVANERHPGRAKAAVRVSAEMDFFRGEVGEPWAPCIFDDGDLADQRPRVLKAFFDPTQAEAMTYVRWGAAKFVRGQARRLAKFGGDNEYNASAEPNGEEWGLAATSPDAAKRTTAILVDMIRPAFPKGMSESNLGAMLKRCNVALNTQHSFFFRPAGKDSVVEKLPLMSSYITAEAGKILMRFLRRKKRRDQEEYDRLLAFEKKEVLQLMAESRAAAGAGDGGGDGADGAAAASSAPAGAAAPREAGVAGGVETAPNDGGMSDRGGGGADARAVSADEEDVFGFGGGMGEPEPTPPRQLTAARDVRVKEIINAEADALMMVPWQAGAAPGSSGDGGAPSGAAAPADPAPAKQPPIVGCHGALSDEDHREQVAIFRSLAKARHGAHENLVTPPRKARKTGLACGGPLSPVDIQEQQAIFASIVAQAHGETLVVDDDGVDLDAEMETLLDDIEAERVGGASQLPGDQTD